MERLTMPNPRSNVVVTRTVRLTSLLAEIEAGEASVLKYLAACYRRAHGEHRKWEVCENTYRYHKAF